VFVNDAFGTAHRAHASNVGVSSNISESAVGLLVQNELEMLGKGLDTPQKPFVAIIGGAKVSDKIAVIENLLVKADKILIGGGMAYTFQKAQGHPIGDSLVENDFIDLAKEFLAKSNGKIILPIDHAIASTYADEPRKITEGIDIPEGTMSLDIGDKSIKLYEEALVGAKTVVWNGPMGVAEFENFKQGTESVAKAIVKQPGVFSVIGGGDSAAAAIKLGFEDKFTHISTGGGASLTYMEGKVLPGIEAIQNK
ncbi:MAG: phosphoglycerate kinase, partial [Mycoplasmataceae bacterium]|nr:phosphoglycerate kinase [Mycoplasmataceae bacterium]